jgi:membrane protein
VLWEAAKYAFTFYATRVGRFEYGGEDSTPIGDTFGVIIAFVFWVYYSGIVLLIGAVVALLHEKAHRARRQGPPPEPPPEDAEEPQTNGQPEESETPPDAPSEVPSEDQSVRS